MCPTAERICARFHAVTAANDWSAREAQAVRLSQFLDCIVGLVDTEFPTAPNQTLLACCTVSRVLCVDAWQICCLTLDQITSHLLHFGIKFLHQVNECDGHPTRQIGCSISWLKTLWNAYSSTTSTNARRVKPGPQIMTQFVRQESGMIALTIARRIET